MSTEERRTGNELERAQAEPIQGKSVNENVMPLPGALSTHMATVVFEQSPYK